MIALVAAAFLSPALTFKQALKCLSLAGLISLAFVIVTNPYLFADWGMFTNDLDRQRKFAWARRCSASPSATAGSTYVAARWAFGVLPGLLAFAGGVTLLVKGVA